MTNEQEYFSRKLAPGHPSIFGWPQTRPGGRVVSHLLGASGCSSCVAPVMCLPRLAAFGAPPVRRFEVRVVDATRCHWLVLQKGSVGRFVIRLFFQNRKDFRPKTNHRREAAAAWVDRQKRASARLTRGNKHALAVRMVALELNSTFLARVTSLL